MSPSLFFTQLAILLLPGVLWARMDANYGNRRAHSQFDFALRAVLFGLTAHAITFLLFVAVGRNFEIIDLSQAEENNALTRGIVIQTVAALGIGFGASILWLYAVNYKWLTRLLQAVKATSTYGDEDVWEYTFNSANQAVSFVHVRDFENRLIYAGWVNVFSESNKMREMVLNEVDIYDFEGNLVSSPPLLYIARKPEGMHIEFPQRISCPETVDDVDTRLSAEELRKPWLRYEGKRGSNHAD